MTRTTSIQRAAKLSALGVEVCFEINEKNKYTLFLFCYYQLKYKTLKEFHCIIYNKNKDILYYLLYLVAKLNSGRYTLKYDH